MGLMNLLMLGVTVFWSANTVAGKFALQGFSPMALAEMRVLGATFGFAVVYVAVRGWPVLRLSWREWAFMALAGFNGVTLNQIFYIGGLARTSVAHTALIVALGPVVVLVLACLMHMERLTAGKGWGMALAFLGVVVLTAGQPAKGSGATALGDVILLIGRLAFAYYTILLKQGIERYNALTLNLLTFATGAVLMVPFSLRPMLEVRWGAVPARSWEGLAFLVIFGTLLAYLVYALALKVMTASHAAAFVYLEPVIAIVLGVWLLSEKVHWEVWVAGAMILLGLFLTGLGKGETRVDALD